MQRLHLQANAHCQCSGGSSLIGNTCTDNTRIMKRAICRTCRHACGLTPTCGLAAARIAFARTLRPMRLHLQARQRADARRHSSGGNSANGETKQAEAGVDKALLQRLEGEQLKGQELSKNLAAAKVGSLNYKLCCHAHGFVDYAPIKRCQLLSEVSIS